MQTNTDFVMKDETIAVKDKFIVIIKLYKI